MMGRMDPNKVVSVAELRAFLVKRGVSLKTIVERSDFVVAFDAMGSDIFDVAREDNLKQFIQSYKYQLLACDSHAELVERAKQVRSIVKRIGDFESLEADLREVDRIIKAKADWQVLGLASPPKNPLQAKQAFQVTIRRIHPDRNRAQGATKAAIRVNDAWSRLKAETPSAYASSSTGSTFNQADKQRRDDEDAHRRREEARRDEQRERVEREREQARRAAEERERKREQARQAAELREREREAREARRREREAAEQEERARVERENMRKERAKQRKENEKLRQILRETQERERQAREEVQRLRAMEEQQARARIKVPDFEQTRKAEDVQEEIMMAQLKQDFEKKLAEAFAIPKFRVEPQNQNIFKVKPSPTRPTKSKAKSKTVDGPVSEEVPVKAPQTLPVKAPQTPSVASVKRRARRPVSGGDPGFTNLFNFLRHREKNSLKTPSSAFSGGRDIHETAGQSTQASESGPTDFKPKDSIFEHNKGESPIFSSSEPTFRFGFDVNGTPSAFDAQDEGGSARKPLFRYFQETTSEVPTEQSSRFESSPGMASIFGPSTPMPQDNGANKPFRFGFSPVPPGSDQPFVFGSFNGKSASPSPPFVFGATTTPKPSSRHPPSFDTPTSSQFERGSTAYPSPFTDGLGSPQSQVPITPDSTRIPSAAPPLFVFGKVKPEGSFSFAKDAPSMSAQNPATAAGGADSEASSVMASIFGPSTPVPQGNGANKPFNFGFPHVPPVTAQPFVFGSFTESSASPSRPFVFGSTATPKPSLFNTQMFAPPTSSQFEGGSAAYPSPFSDRFGSPQSQVPITPGHPGVSSTAPFIFGKDTSEGSFAFVKDSPSQNFATATVSAADDVDSDLMRTFQSLLRDVEVKSRGDGSVGNSALPRARTFPKHSPSSYRGAARYLPKERSRGSVAVDTFDDL